MPLPKDVTWVTFDVYGTLIDWETGRLRRVLEGGRARRLHAVARRAAPRSSCRSSRRSRPAPTSSTPRSCAAPPCASRASSGWPLEPSRSGFLPDSVQRWPPFKETNTQLERFAKKFEIGLISNIDDKLLGQTRRHFKHDFDLVVTAQQVRSYKPDPAHFKEAERRIGGKKGWVHVASSYYYDVEPCLKAKIPVIWVNRRKETLDPGQKKPTAEVKNLLEAAKLLGAA